MRRDDPSGLLCFQVSPTESRAVSGLSEVSQNPRAGILDRPKPSTRLNIDT